MDSKKKKAVKRRTAKRSLAGDIRASLQEAIAYASGKRSRAKVNRVTKR